MLNKTPSINAFKLMQIRIPSTDPVNNMTSHPNIVIPAEAGF